MPPNPDTHYRLSPTKIRRLMVDRGLTQSEVARRMAGPGQKPRPETLSRLLREAPEQRSVRPQTINRLLSALGAKQPEEICARNKPKTGAPKPKRGAKARRAPIFYDPKRSYTLDELMEMQGAKWFDVAELFGKWPGDKDDGFEEMINESRMADLALEQQRERQLRRRR